MEKKEEDKRYHTNSEEYPPKHREVYHDHEDCKDGKRIMAIHRVTGDGGKPKCDECIRLDKAATGK